MDKLEEITLLNVEKTSNLQLARIIKEIAESKNGRSFNKGNLKGHSNYEDWGAYSDWGAYYDAAV